MKHCGRREVWTACRCGMIPNDSEPIVSKTMRLVERISLILSLLGMAGLVLGIRFGFEVLLPWSALLCVLGVMGFALEAVVRRREYLAKGDDTTGDYIYGFQAVSSGLSQLLLCLIVLAAAAAWVFPGHERLMKFIFTYPGALLMVFGACLLLQCIGCVFGRALSNLGHPGVGPVDTAIMVFNGLLEKAISLILSVAGFSMIILGWWSLSSGKGPLELLLGLL